MSVLNIALLVALVFTQNEAARILAVFPVPSISHQVVFRPLTQELARRGHDVTVITPDPAFPKGSTPPNFTEIDVHDISYTKWEELYKITSRADNDLYSQMKAGFTMLIEIVEIQIKVAEVQKLIKENKYDLLLIEACTRPALVWTHVFKVPAILISSFGTLNFNIATIGASWHPLLYPNSLSQRLYNMTKWEKIEGLWNFYKLEGAMDKLEDSENEMIRRLFGPDVPPISELKNNVDMMFLNVHPIWEDNRPVPPSVIYMGGMHQKPVNELPQDLKTFLDSSKNGVIYLSLGTNVKPSLLPPERVQMLVKVFSELPYDVLWKWDKDELPGRTENIRISKWLPQSDLLRHPKIRVFVTQGGLQSTDEALTAGVPLIGLPMLGDQWYNVEKYIYHKIGVKLDMETLTEEQFRNAINTVIGDESYRLNVERLRQLMSDQPQRPLERAVWWTEHVLRHGGASHLRAPAANITWSQYLELDLVLTILGVILALFSVFLILIYHLWKVFYSTNQSKKVKKN